MTEHPEYVEELDELTDNFDHGNAREGLEAALLKGQELERAKWKAATEVDTPELAEKRIAKLYEWLESWQEWARHLLEEKGRQLEDGWHGDSQAREILGSLLSEARGAPTNEDDMCPNCVTPWKCNGPHEIPDEEFMVSIIVNAEKHQVPFGMYMDYDAVVMLAWGKVQPYMTVTYSGKQGSGSLVQGGAVVKAFEGMVFNAMYTGNA